MNKEQQNQHFYARLAGLSYIIFTLAGFVKTLYLNGRLADVASFRAGSFFENEMHFRFELFAETVMFLGVVMASVSFYFVFRSINKQLAQTALLLRMIEIIIGSMAVVFGMTILALANNSSLLASMELEQVRTLMRIIASLITPAYEYSWIAMGFAGVLTFYLFHKTRFIPRFWGVWGMITYTSLIVYPIAKMLIPDLPKEVMYVMFPGALFELLVGLWLVIKGIKMPMAQPQ